MERTIVSSLVAAIATIGVTAGVSAAQPRIVSAAACTSGPTTYQGVRAYVGCGPATAVLKLGGRALHFRGGSSRRQLQTDVERARTQHGHDDSR
jgi:hypothetical protein